ncbi:MAG: PspC domain-containing protein [Propionibacteriaceae bacterium]|nr:PspC domain-containing protein [Propionibacteriaceae bacterium]
MDNNNNNNRQITNAKDKIMNLTRSDDDKWIAGVAGGIAETVGVDSTIVRIVFATVGVFFFGTGILLYLALWAILPRPTGGTIAQDGINKAKAWNDSRKNGATGSTDFDI